MSTAELNSIAETDALARGPLTRVLDRTSRAAQLVGGVALVLMMLLTVSDVVMRNLFSIVVPGSLELNGLLMVLVALSTLALVELARGHIHVDLVLGRLPDYARRPTIAGGLLLALATIVITAVQVSRQVDYLWDSGIVSGVLRLPEWPFAVAAAVALVLFAFALLSNLLAAVCNVARLRDARAWVVALLWVVVAATILCLVLAPDLVPVEIPRAWGGIVCGLLCFALIFLGVQVAAAMALAALAGISLVIGPAASVTSLGTTTLNVVSDPTWSVIPLFTWMGLLVVASGFAEELYRAAYRWIGHLPGGLASASTVSCAGLSSIVGDTLSGVYSMGSIALPQMKAYGYDMKLATASIACAATIGVMIPPSLAFIVYGMITEVSIGKLFMAGVVPGILFAIVLVGLITVRAVLNPSLAPRGPVSSWPERLEASKGVWPILLLMILVLGGIYSGAVTANEAGGIGAAGALLIALVMRRMSWDAFLRSIGQTLRMTATIMLIFIFATAFSRFVAVSGLTQQLIQLVNDWQLGPYQLIAAIVVFYIVIGMFMNALPAMVLTVPLFYPMAMNAGFDPIWFGVLVVIMVELGVVTPPIGVNIFAIASMTKDVTMYQIFQGVIPFWIAYLMLVLLIILFPGIALFLPSLM
jgi:tripartite ATP-independent transporter DctM subunit